MKEKQFSFAYKEYQEEDLSAEDRRLLREAERSATDSYAPYSQFHVGAAIRLDNGKIVAASNQENVAYPSSLCAERVAAFYASSSYPGVPFDTIAVTAFADNFQMDAPVTPCGACRQVLAEYEKSSGRKLRVIMKGASGKILEVNSVKSLLPFTFEESKLRKK